VLGCYGLYVAFACHCRESGLTVSLTRFAPLMITETAGPAEDPHLTLTLVA